MGIRSIHGKEKLSHLTGQIQVWEQQACQDLKYQGQHTELREDSQNILSEPRHSSVMWNQTWVTHICGGHKISNGLETPTNKILSVYHTSILNNQIHLKRILC